MPDLTTSRTEGHDRDQLRALFRDFGDPVPHLLAQLEDGDPVHVGRIEEVDLDRFVDQRVVLVGDTAHATSPSMAQGASMALEDALTLAGELMSCVRRSKHPRHSPRGEAGASNGSSSGRTGAIAFPVCLRG